MKLNRLQRHTAYIICLAEFEEFKKNSSEYGFSHDGFCYFFFNVMGLEGEHGGYDKNINVYFPEIIKRKPKEAGWLWFPANKLGGVSHRIELLKQCIQETY